MAKFGAQFDSREVEPFSIIPEGWYIAQIVKSDYKPTKNNDGHYISLQFVILDGEYQKRTLFTNINIDNPNQIAVEIAQRNFSALCRACGVDVCEDTEQLHGKPIEINVKVTPPQGNYSERNDIKGYRTLENIPTFDQEESKPEETTTDETDLPPSWLNEI